MAAAGDAPADLPPLLKQLQSGRPVAGYSNTPEQIKKHLAVTKGVPYFRFPPEPNGYLHIGHAKSMNLNFGEAAAHGGVTYLRYDDTNPESEEVEYIQAIEEMVRWLGYNPQWVTFSSDQFEKLHECAVELIKKGLAYVDHSTAEEMHKQRGERLDSPWRDRPVAENLKLFEHMRQGRYAEGAATLRVKGDMQSDNPNMRDFVAYRIKYSPHPHVGDKWCIYPSYDFTHCLVDSLENIDYSCCTLEFETRRESYFWLLDVLGMWKPHVYEFSRLNVTGALLSKRKINHLVHEKIVRGFDDPRLLTLAGLRRRGYRPESINRFCKDVGVTRNLNVIQLAKLENVLREDLDEKCLRRLGVIEPLECVVEGGMDAAPAEVEAPEHPRKTELGNRKVTFSSRFFIDRSDFRTEDVDPKYYGLAPGKTVGLKYGPNFTCSRFDADATTGLPTKVFGTVDFARAVKPKTNISWVDAATAVDVEFRLYTPLLTDDKAATETDFMKYIDPHSEVISHGKCEPAVKALALRESVQLERFAYFTVDDDSTGLGTAGVKLVMNRVVGLKEDKDKVAAPDPRRKK